MKKLVALGVVEMALFALRYIHCELIQQNSLVIRVEIWKLCETLSGLGNTDGNSLWRQRTFPEETWAIEARAYSVPPDVAMLFHQHVTETTVEAHGRQSALINRSDHQYWKSQLGYTFERTSRTMWTTSWYDFRDYKHHIQKYISWSTHILLKR